MKNEVVQCNVDHQQELPQFKLRTDGKIEYTGNESAQTNETRMLEVFGTKSRKTLQHYLNQLAKVAGCEEMEEAILFFNDITPIIRAIGPRNELEGILAVQMIGIHTLAMEMMKRAMYPDQTVNNVNHNVNRITKLTRTFIAQMEALNKHRSKGQQKMTVEHVHVNKGGQAVIGNVEKRGCGGESSEN